MGKQKFFVFPFVGFLHALVFWGFCVILIGSIEMLIDGLFGTDRVLSILGWFYVFIMASGDIFAFVILIAVFAFVIRRLFMHVKRFYGKEMKPISKIDANIALAIIGILMITLLGMNTFYILYSRAAGHEVAGLFPVSNIIAGWFGSLPKSTLHTWHEINWWAHILWIFIFANILPYSKHFHVFMSVPNVFLSRLEPLGYLYNMPEITKEVKLMMDPDAAFQDMPEEEEETARFGVKDADDGTWKKLC